MRFPRPFRRPGQRPCNGRTRLRLARGLAVVCATTAAASAQGPNQLRFSIDFQGPTIADQPAPGSPQYSDSDLLVRQGNPFDPGQPVIAYLGDYLARYSSCLDHAPGFSCGVELNAFSFGRDARLRDDPQYRFSVYLSVDEWAVGSPSSLGFGIPTVFSEATFSDAASDTFALPLIGVFPFQPIFPAAVGVADGNGRRATANTTAFPGVGLEEPINPDPSSAADDGDNLDALDLGPRVNSAFDPLYFSLQAGFSLCNEFDVPIVDSASLQTTATGQTAVGADVLRFDPQGGGGAGALTIYASAQSLGLDRFGPGRDDVDALSLWDNGDGVYQPPTGPYSWIVPDSFDLVTDLLLYSVRCGSEIVETFDMGGLPITEGDVLIKYAGDPRPTIFVRAEALGLDTTSRAFANDEVDGLDFVDGGGEPFTDCQPNGTEDAYDIAGGTSPDDDLNGIPDECEEPKVYCTCEAASSAPCNNSGAADEGCVNVTGFGGRMIGAGTTSISTDFLSLRISQVPANQFALVFMGSTAFDVPLGNGRMCVGPAQIRLQVVATDASGQATYGPGIISYVTSLPSPPAINIGSTWGFQAWYRDLQTSCTSLLSNVTNGVLVTFTP
ncbi:MAG: hypothetical protein VXZ39_08610 [Planctomycetota bacterium]|nr:hypothetical protein [Planctomycetota bacterium]MEC8494971.1 hypothetical protein [Planctomycetota bacterium]MEC8512606.1 hypothetical protein [Planctomycetota bacterium]